MPLDDTDLDTQSRRPTMFHVRPTPEGPVGLLVDPTESDAWFRSSLVVDVRR
jgi:hypothetical protein